MGRRRFKFEVDDSELRITEIALGLLMDEISDPYIQTDPSGVLHECCVCAKKDVWGPNWWWFGSYRDDARCLKTCSRECFEQDEVRRGDGMRTEGGITIWPDATQREWRSVHDVLPAIYEPVLAFDGKKQWVAKYMGGRFASIPGEWTVKVSHWMPLPTQPM